MTYIVRATIRWLDGTLDRHFAVYGSSETAAANAIRREQGGEVSIVGHMYADGATDYFPARAPRA